jgi:Linalool dehydratase/isomerase
MTTHIDATPKPPTTGPPTLTSAQLGHLRHFDNLSRLQVNDWSLMQGPTPHQDDFTGYRFQLAYMIYAAALTHRNLLPAAPGRFQPMIQRLVDKLLEPEVWLYWRDTSRGGAAWNAHLSESYVEQWDPVVRDNIMYSAYVQSTALLHDYLFASDRYAAPGSLTFKFWSMFWGGEEKRSEYDRESLNEHIYWQLVRNGYIGIACEPNCVFQICNQPAILGFRMHDLITGGSRAAEVIVNYEKAWEEFGRLNVDGHYNAMVIEDSRTIVPNPGAAWMDAWCGTLMHMWNREFVRDNYERQVADFIAPQPDGTLCVVPSPKVGPDGSAAPYPTSDLGWLATWASELGDVVTRDGVLAYADQHMKPAERDGGLYYTRNDSLYDDAGRYVEMDPLTGNALLAYARLNVEDGLWTLFNEPWDLSHFEAPALTGVSVDIDVSAAAVQDGVLRACVQRRSDIPGDGEVTIGRALRRGDWRLMVDGAEVATVEADDVSLVTDSGSILVTSVDADLVLHCRDVNSHDICLTPRR